MTQWIKHDGGPMPVHLETVVSVRSNTGVEGGSCVCVAYSLPWSFMTQAAGFEYAIIRAHPDCPSLKNTAVDMARAGIAPSVEVWRVEYENDVGQNDEGLWQWWEVTDGKKTFKSDTEAEAQWLADRLNGMA